MLLHLADSLPESRPAQPLTGVDGTLSLVENPLDPCSVHMQSIRSSRPPRMSLFATELRTMARNSCAKRWATTLRCSGEVAEWSKATRLPIEAAGVVSLLVVQSLERWPSGRRRPDCRSKQRGLLAS